MTRLDRYLFRTVFLTGLATLGILAALGVIFLFLDEVGKIGERYSFGMALGFVFLSLPAYLYDFFPLATLIGALMGLGTLASHSELIVMRAAGLSMARLARPVLLAGLALAAVGLILGEGLGPLGQAEARAMRAQAMEEALSFQTRSGLWLRDEDRFVNARQVTVGGVLLDVSVYAFAPDGALEWAVRAERAQRDGDGWRLYGVRRTTPAGESLHMEQVNEERWSALVPPRMLDVAVVHPQHMAVPDLLTYARHLSRNGLDNTPYLLALWVKLFVPLGVIAMLVIALPFAFSSQRAANAGQRLFIGIVLGIVFLTLSRIINYLGPVYGLAPFLSAALPPALFLLLGLVALKRQA